LIDRTIDAAHRTRRSRLASRLLSDRARDAMKKIEAIIRPFEVDQVKAALDRLGIPGLTVGEVHGHGSDCGPLAASVAAGSITDGLPQVKIEILLDDAAVDEAVASIARATGVNGAGEPSPLFIAPVDEVVRIRTGERGAAAV
jgi:nitrogen regulatory protein P-II 1